jgi:predicted N-acetyltransferase YhbS
MVNNMIIIRNYLDRDAESVGKLIAETYGDFNLSFASSEKRNEFLGPFQHAWSTDKSHKEEIARVLKASIMYVALKEDRIVGVLRGKTDKLQSLFVSGTEHRQGIGRNLVDKYEAECIAQGSETIKLMSTLYAVPFYQSVGYRKSTGVRSMKSFDGDGLRYQPMKKILTHP